MKLFCEQRQFKFAQNYHTFSNLLIYPWAWSDEPATTDLITYAKVLTAQNNYKYGTATETVGYQVNGSSDDWMFGDRNTFSFTPEVGPQSSGFWPQPNEIDNLNKSAMYLNLVTAQLPLHFVESGEHEVSFNQSQGTVALPVTRYGLQNGPIIVSLSPLSTNIVQTSAAQNLTMSPLETRNLSFNFTNPPSLTVTRSNLNLGSIMAAM